MNAKYKLYLDIIAALGDIQALPIITGELSFLASTHQKYLSAGLSLRADIVLYSPVVTSKREGVRVKHGEGELGVVSVVHLPLLIKHIPCDRPSFGPHIASCVIITPMNGHELFGLVHWLEICKLILCVHDSLLT